MTISVFWAISHTKHWYWNDYKNTECFHTDLILSHESLSRKHFVLSKVNSVIFLIAKCYLQVLLWISIIFIILGEYFSQNVGVFSLESFYNFTRQLDKMLFRILLCHHMSPFCIMYNPLLGISRGYYLLLKICLWPKFYISSLMKKVQFVIFIYINLCHNLWKHYIVRL